MWHTSILSLYERLCQTFATKADYLFLRKIHGYVSYISIKKKIQVEKLHALVTRNIKGQT